MSKIQIQLGFPRIDILKLDCEGSEFSILDNADLSRIGTIFVESHGSHAAGATCWSDVSAAGTSAT